MLGKLLVPKWVGDKIMLAPCLLVRDEKGNDPNFYHPLFLYLGILGVIPTFSTYRTSKMNIWGKLYWANWSSLSKVKSTFTGVWLRPNQVAQTPLVATGAVNMNRASHMGWACVNIGI